MGEKALSTATYETYLQIEAESDVKHEFHDGLIVAMAGGTPTHSLLGANANTALNIALRSKGAGCRVYNSELKIRVPSTNRALYPDATVICGDPEFNSEDPHGLLNPILIVEVLSDSTDSYDRGDKFFHYRQIPSLKEYLLVSQNNVKVESFFRREENLWEINYAIGREDSIILKSLGVELSMADLYRMVEMEG